MKIVDIEEELEDVVNGTMNESLTFLKDALEKLLGVIAFRVTPPTCC